MRNLYMLPVRHLVLGLPLWYLVLAVIAMVFTKCGALGCLGTYILLALFSIPGIFLQDYILHYPAPADASAGLPLMILFSLLAYAIIGLTIDGIINWINSRQKKSRV